MKTNLKGVSSLRKKLYAGGFKEAGKIQFLAKRMTWFSTPLHRGRLPVYDRGEKIVIAREDYEKDDSFICILYTTTGSYKGPACYLDNARFNTLVYGKFEVQMLNKDGETIFLYTQNNCNE